MVPYVARTFLQYEIISATDRPAVNAKLVIKFNIASHINIYFNNLSKKKAVQNVNFETALTTENKN